MVHNLFPLTITARSATERYSLLAEVIYVHWASNDGTDKKDERILTR